MEYPCTIYIELSFPHGQQYPPSHNKHLTDVQIRNFLTLNQPGLPLRDIARRNAISP
jgi:hypothetical protein